MSKAQGDLALQRDRGVTFVQLVDAKISISEIWNFESLCPLGQGLSAFKAYLCGTEAAMEKNPWTSFHIAYNVTLQREPYSTLT